MLEFLEALEQILHLKESGNMPKFFVSIRHIGAARECFFCIDFPCEYNKFHAITQNSAEQVYILDVKPIFLVQFFLNLLGPIESTLKNIQPCSPIVKRILTSPSLYVCKIIESISANHFFFVQIYLSYFFEVIRRPTSLDSLCIDKSKPTKSDIAINKIHCGIFEMCKIYLLK